MHVAKKVIIVNHEFQHRPIIAVESEWSRTEIINDRPFVYEHDKPHESEEPSYEHN